VGRDSFGRDIGCCGFGRSGCVHCVLLCGKLSFSFIGL